MQAVALERGTFDIHLELRRASFGLVFDLRRAGRFLKNVFDLLCEFFQHVVVVAEDLHGEFGLRSFEHFVDTHLDWLCREEVVVGVHLRKHRADLFVQLGLGARTARRFGPCVKRLVENVNVALIRRHRVGGNVARADAGEHTGDFGKVSQKLLFDFHVGAEGFLQAHADGLVEHRSNRAFVELGDKLGAQAGEQPDRAGQQRHRTSDCQPTSAESGVERRPVKPFDPLHHPVVAFMEFAAQQQ